MRIPRIVCLGAGYVGINFARVLRSNLKKGKVKLSIVDRENFHVFHGLVPEMVAGKINPHTITTPARTLFLYADFYFAEIQEVNLRNHCIGLSRELDGKQISLPFDHLVLGIGTNDNLSNYPGLEENAFRLRRFEDAFKLRHHIPQMLELAEFALTPQERAEFLTFVVAGGNFAGVEVCTELAVYRDSLKKMGSFSKFVKDFRIILVHAGDTLLPELSNHYPKLGQYTREKLLKYGVEIRLQTKLAAATPISAITDQQEEITTRTIISCVGMSPNPLIKQCNLETDSHGRILTDQFLRVQGQENLWAGGDCAAVPHQSGGYCPPLAVYAMHAGRTIGRNLLAQLEQKPLYPYRYESRISACSLSKHTAIMQVRGVTLTGFVAWLMWRIEVFKFIPTNAQRLKLAADYLVGLFTGRDVINLNIEPKLAIAERYYEKDQIILKKGDYGNSMFIIISGEAEIIDTDGEEGENGEEGNKPAITIAHLQQGDHFGELAIFNHAKRSATVKAKTAIKVLELKSQAAQAISLKFPEITRHSVTH